MRVEDILHVDAATARRFLVERHHLSTPRSLEAGPDGVRAAFARLGSIQFDPLGVAGRNHDLVLHARVAGYQSSWTDALLYDTRELFEAYNKGLSLLPTPELPWFRVTWDVSQSEHRSGVLSRYETTVNEVLERIRTDGPLSSLDFERKTAVDWWWGPTSESRAVLEALADSGILGLARREGNRRYYDLIERLFPADLMAIRPTERDQRRHKLLSRYRAHGLLGAGGQAEIFLGCGKARRTTADPPDAIIRSELLDEFVADGELVTVDVEGVRGRRYVLDTERDMMQAAQRPSTDVPAVTFLAPLDPFAWDRDLMRSLFGFDYVWEVYVPEHKRRWGYYVLPILFGDRLVGRIEPRIDRANGTVRILGLWWEEWFDPRTADGLVPAMRAALAAYLAFGGARTIEWAPHLGAEKRLFGVRPRA